MNTMTERQIWDAASEALWHANNGRISRHRAEQVLTAAFAMLEARAAMQNRALWSAACNDSFHDDY